MGTLLNRRRYMGGGSAPIPDYLKLTAVEDTTFTITIPANIGTSTYEYIEYSVNNGGTWVKTNNVASTEVVVNIPLVSSGNNVLLRGKGKGFGGETVYCSISSSGKFSASGNIVSLLAVDDFETFTVSNAFAIANIFKNSMVTDASALTLYKGAATRGIFASMFEGCVYLTHAPTVCTSNAAQNSFLRMFLGCTSLIDAGGPLPPDVKINSHSDMYNGCTSLVNAPVIPCTFTYNNGMNRMFKDCTSLQYIKYMTLNQLVSSTNSDWVLNVPTGGTFVKNSAATWTNSFSKNQIPQGWTVITEDS